MKKISPLLITLVTFVLLLSPVLIALAVDPAMSTQCTMSADTGLSKCPAKGVACPFDNTTFSCGLCCLMNVIYTVTDWMFFGLIAMVILFVLLGAWNIMNAGGDPKKVDTGRNYVVYAGVGLAVAFAAKLVPALAKFITGLN